MTQTIKNILMLVGFVVSALILYQQSPITRIQPSQPQVVFYSPLGIPPPSLGPGYDAHPDHYYDELDR